MQAWQPPCRCSPSHEERAHSCRHAGQQQQQQSASARQQSPCTSYPAGTDARPAAQRGLKTGMYYLRTRAAADAIKFTVDQLALAKTKAARVAAKAAAAQGPTAAPLKVGAAWRRS